jgi:hypothetical protein
VACDSVVVVQLAAGGVAIERRFNLAVAVIGAIQIQNVSACTCGRTARVCACCFPYYAFTSAVAVADLAMCRSCVTAVFCQ